MEISKKRYRAPENETPTGRGLGKGAVQIEL